MAKAHVSEVWAKIPGFPSYKVSNLGRIKRIVSFTCARCGQKVRGSARIIVGWQTKKGYIAVEIAGVTKFVHTLVMLTFVGRAPDGYQINHKDYDKTNNTLANLEYVTPKQNMQHAVTGGRCVKPRGSAHWKAKLTEDDVAEIKAWLEAGVPVRRIAKHKHVSPGTVYNIKNGTGWKHVK